MFVIIAVKVVVIREMTARPWEANGDGMTKNHGDERDSTDQIVNMMAMIMGLRMMVRKIVYKMVNSSEESDVIHDDSLHGDDDGGDCSDDDEGEDSNDNDKVYDSDEDYFEHYFGYKLHLVILVVKGGHVTRYGFHVLIYSKALLKL